VRICSRQAIWIIAFGSILLLGSHGNASSWQEKRPRCYQVALRGYLNVLSINILFSEIENRDTRLEMIGDFVAEKDVDLILIQEVVGGVLAGTENSAKDLRNILLSRHHLNYSLKTAFEIGVPGILATYNALLSRCEIKFNLVKRLPPGTEIEIDGRPVKLGRNVMLSRVNIPFFGRLNVYNTHLCAACEIDERDQQLEVLLRFLNTVENLIPGENRVILGGDFNIDRFDNNGAERFLYDKIIARNFNDTYAEFIFACSGQVLDELCEDEDNADEHCTVGVSLLNGPNARRIDYVFSRGFVDVRQAVVVFNTLVNPHEPTVSDHAGVLIRLDLY
jgi:maltose 6'-phosphate phosphatase